MSGAAPDKATPIPLGSLWAIPAKTEALVTRPDGAQFRVSSDGSTAGYVLDQDGEHLAEVDGKTYTVTAG